MTRPDCSRAEASSGCSNTDRIAEATMLRCDRGTRSRALRVAWTRQRCHAAPSSSSLIAFTSPRWSSLMTRRTPERPRSTRPLVKAGQAAPSSLPGLSSSPSTRRSPDSGTPVATSAAIDTTRPPSRTNTPVASSQR